MSVGQEPLSLLLAALGGYALGSIPFGLIFMRMAGFGDIRKMGSGNIGATNVLRAGNWPLALATLLCDGAKGAIAVLIAGALAGPLASAIAGCCAFLGHVYPVWLRFKGGKGVATYFGILLAFAWLPGLIAGATWLLVAALFRFSSLAALVAALAAPFYFAALGHGGFGLAAAFCSVLIYVRHRANIRRLMTGTEPRIGSKSDSPREAAKP